MLDASLREVAAVPPSSPSQGHCGASATGAVVQRVSSMLWVGPALLFSGSGGCVAVLTSTGIHPLVTLDDSVEDAQLVRAVLHCVVLCCAVLCCAVHCTFVVSWWMTTWCRVCVRVCCHVLRRTNDVARACL